MLNLIVKAKRIEDAVNAATQRDIVIANSKQSTETEVSLTAPEYELRKVYAWFNEENESPFPVGTLLWFGNMYDAETILTALKEGRKTLGDSHA